MGFPRHASFRSGRKSGRFMAGAGVGHHPACRERSERKLGIPPRHPGRGLALNRLRARSGLGRLLSREIPCQRMSGNSRQHRSGKAQSRLPAPGRQFRRTGKVAEYLQPLRRILATGAMATLLRPSPEMASLSHRGSKCGTIRRARTRRTPASENENAAAASGRRGMFTTTRCRRRSCRLRSQPAPSRRTPGRPRVPFHRTDRRRSRWSAAGCRCGYRFRAGRDHQP